MKMLSLLGTLAQWALVNVFAQSTSLLFKQVVVFFG